MKKIITFTFILFYINSYAQFGKHTGFSSSLPFPTTPKITVKGTSILEIVPNQIYFKITLKEDRVSRKKTQIDSLENQLFKILDQFQISRTNLNLSHSSQRIIDKKRSDTEVEVTRQYNLLVTDKTNLRSLLLAFNENKFYNIYVSHINHTDKEKLMQQQREKAMKIAQQKAIQLLNAVDQEPGALLDVSAIGNNTHQFTNLRAVNSSYNSYISSKKYKQYDFNYAKLQLQASYQLIYEIKSK